MNNSTKGNNLVDANLHFDTLRDLDMEWSNGIPMEIFRLNLRI